MSASSWACWTVAKTSLCFFSVVVSASESAKNEPCSVVAVTFPPKLCDGQGLPHAYEWWLLTREGANREKLTVKKLIDNEMFFFSPFMSLTNREKSA